MTNLCYTRGDKFLEQIWYQRNISCLVSSDWQCTVTTRVIDNQQRVLVVAKEVMKGVNIAYINFQVITIIFIFMGDIFSLFLQFNPNPQNVVHAKSLTSATGDPQDLWMFSLLPLVGWCSNKSWHYFTTVSQPLATFPTLMVTFSQNPIIHVTGEARCQHKDAGPGAVRSAH